MIFHCREDGAVLTHFAANNKYWRSKCRLYRTRVEVAFIRGGKCSDDKIVSSMNQEPDSNYSSIPDCAV